MRGVRGLVNAEELPNRDGPWVAVAEEPLILGHKFPTVLDRGPATNTLSLLQLGLPAS